MPKTPKTPAENTEPTRPDDPVPPAGPHSRPELTDNEKTPGTGSLPDDTSSEGDVGPD